MVRVDTVATETNEVVESIREVCDGIRDQIEVLNSGFRQLAPSTQHPTLPAVPPATVEVAVPAPETRTIQGPPAPVDISALVPLF